MRCKSLLVPALAAMGAFIAEGAVVARPTEHSSGGHPTVGHSADGHGQELARGGGGGGRGGGGGGGRGGGGFGRGGGGYGRGGGGYGGGGYGGYGGYGYGGLGGFYGGYGFWPGFYGGGYGYGGGPGYGYYDYGPAYYGPAYGDAYGAAVPYANPAPTVAAVHVIVPDPNARVWFDGVLTHQTGTDRWFQSTTTGGTYDIKASWMQDGHEMTQDRNVAVSPGQTAMVDFDQPVSTGK